MSLSLTSSAISVAASLGCTPKLGCSSTELGTDTDGDPGAILSRGVTNNDGVPGVPQCQEPQSPQDFPAACPGDTQGSPRGARVGRGHLRAGGVGTFVTHVRHRRQKARGHGSAWNAGDSRAQAGTRRGRGGDAARGAGTRVGQAGVARGGRGAVAAAIGCGGLMSRAAVT